MICGLMVTRYQVSSRRARQKVLRVPLCVHGGPDKEATTKLSKNHSKSY